MNLSTYCLDTHSLIWYFTGHSALSARALAILESVFKDEALGIVPVLVILEIFHFSLKKPGFNFPKFMGVITNSNIELYPLDNNVLREAIFLPREVEIHDRTIGATAVVTNSVLLTKDPILKKVKGLEVVW